MIFSVYNNFESKQSIKMARQIGNRYKSVYDYGHYVNEWPTIGTSLYSLCLMVFFFFVQT